MTAPLTRSELASWDVSYLVSAAARWRAAADDSDDLFTGYQQTVGDTDWSGSGRDAAYDRVSSDTHVVRSQSEIQRAAATIAEGSAGDQRNALQATLDAIAEAESDGFKVSEELSVRDARRYDITTIVARNKAAQEHAENIRWNADQLVQADSLVGLRLHEKAAELEGIRFEDSTIQAASWGGLKQDGGPEEPWEPDVIKTEPKPHEPTVIDASPDPMFPNCDTGDVWNNLGQVLGGTAVIAIGIAGVPLTLGGSLSAVIGGGATVVGGINGMRHCG